MGKKPTTSIPQKHVRSRLSYLYQAANYLSKEGDTRIEGEQSVTDTKHKFQSSTTGQSKYLVNHIKGISKKSVLRLRTEIKRSICKRCDSLLSADSASVSYIENKSKNKSKAWADVLIIECTTCHNTKRFPVGKNVSRPKRQTGKSSIAKEVRNLTRDGEHSITKK